MPGLAGVSRMPYRRFLVYNAAGGLSWGVGVVLLGYFAGESYARVATLLSRSSAVIIGVVALGALIIWRMRRHRARRRAQERRGVLAGSAPSTRTAGGLRHAVHSDLATAHWLART